MLQRSVDIYEKFEILGIEIQVKRATCIIGGN